METTDIKDQLSQIHKTGFLVGGPTKRKLGSLLSIFNKIKHITMVGVLSLVQVVIIMTIFYLHFKTPANSLGNIEKGITELTVGQKNIQTDIATVKQQIIIMVVKDSLMNNQLQHYPATLPLAPGDLTRSSSTYSERIDPITGDKRFHWGIDYPAKKGTPVYATASGIIEKADDNDSNYGKVIKINHLNGYESLYAHLDQIDVTLSEDIKRGDLIGTVGNTGRATGNHLHYEISYMERHINPNIFRTPLKPVLNTEISGLLNYRNFIASIK